MSKDAAITFINNAANFNNSTLGTGTDYDAALFDNGAGTDKGRHLCLQHLAGNAR